MGKNTADVAILVRVSAKDKQALEKEAEAQSRSLSNYIKWLLATHQDRDKKKG